MRKKILWPFCIYCVLIASVAAMNFAVSPNDQPLNDISTIVVMICAILGVYFKKEKLLFFLCAHVLIRAIIAISENKNLPALIGSIIGWSIPLFLTYLAYKEIKTNRLK